MLKMRFLVVASCVSAIAIAVTAEAAEKKYPTSAPSEPVWTLVTPAYRVLSMASFFEAIDKAHIVGLKYIEGRPYKIGAETGDAELGPSAPPEALEKVKRKLKETGLTLISYYAGNFGKNEAEMRRLFKFGKSMGIQVFVGEPSPDKLATLDKLANEFGITVAFHNHPRKPKQSGYKNWDPAFIMQMVSKCSPRIGCCADTGHWMRSGLDPVKCLKQYEGRLLYLHLKDATDKTASAEDAIMGTGAADAKGMLAELHRQKFSGPIAFEYDKANSDRPADVRKSAECVRRMAAELGQKLQ